MIELAYFAVPAVVIAFVGGWEASRLLLNARLVRADADRDFFRDAARRSAEDCANAQAQRDEMRQVNIGLRRTIESMREMHDFGVARKAAVDRYNRQKKVKRANNRALHEASGQ